MTIKAIIQASSFSSHFLHFGARIATVAGRVGLGVVVVLVVVVLNVVVVGGVYGAVY